MLVWEYFVFGPVMRSYSIGKVPATVVLVSTAQFLIFFEHSQGFLFFLSIGVEVSGAFYLNQLPWPYERLSTKLGSQG